MSSDDLIEMALSCATFENEADGTNAEQDLIDEELVSDDLDANRFVAQCDGTISEQTIPVIQQAFSQIPEDQRISQEELEQRLYAVADTQGFRETLAQQLFMSYQGTVPLKFLQQQINSLTAEQIVSSATEIYRIGMSSQTKQ
jgi:hypothetical protein